MRIWADAGVPIVGASGDFFGEPGETLYAEAGFALEVVDGRAIATIGEPPISGKLDYRVTVEGIISDVPTSRTLVILNATFGTRDLGSAADLLGPFASTPWSGMSLGVRTYDGELPSTVFDFVEIIRGEALAAPGMVAATAATGGPNEIDVTITDDAVDAGDGLEAGDGLGGTLQVQYRLNSNDTLIGLLGDGVLEEATKTIPNLGSANTFRVEVRARSAFRAGEWSDLGMITSGAVVIPPSPPVFVAGPTLNMVAGQTLTIQWTTYFTNAVSYNVTSGIAGGIQSGTGNVTYTKTALAQGNYTIQCVATSADGNTATGTVSVVVASAVVAPTLTTPIPENYANLVIGNSVNFSVAGNFGGSTPKTYALSPTNVGLTINSSTGVITGGPFASTLAATTITVTVTNSAGSANDTFTLAIAAVAPPALTTTGSNPNVRVFDAQVRYAPNPPTAVNQWRYPRFVVQGLAPNCRLEWSTSAKDANGNIPNSAIESGFDVVGGYYIPQMTDVAKRGNPDLQTPRLDYSLNYEGNDPRANRWWVRQYDTVNLIAGPISEVAMTCPPVTSAVERTWLQAVMRPKGAYDADVVGNAGQQFERVVAWNMGRNDPDKAGHILFGQDENNMWMSQNGTDLDGPALMGSPISDGLFCVNMAGIYLNSDDNIVVAAGAGYPLLLKTGLYLSTDWTKTFTRVLTERPDFPDGSGNSRGFINILNGSNPRRPQNCIARRPQNAAGTLTHAQRPIYVIENHRSGGTMVGATEVFVWRSDDNMATIECVAQLTPTSTFVTTSSSSDGGIHYVIVAPNGDVLICSAKGIWLSQNLGVTWTRCQINGNTNDRDVVAIAWRGGDATTVSGAYCAIDSTTYAGVVRTDNIRTTGFTRPVGQTPANIATVPATHMGVSPTNPDRIVLVRSNNLAAHLSTDGGVTFTPITDTAGTGDEDGRYRVSGGAAAVYCHPYDENIWFACTTQTMARSINGGVSFEGDRVAFFDGSHDKGWGFSSDADDPESWKKIGFVQQDYAVRYSLDGLNYFYNSGLNYTDNYGNTTIGGVLLDEAASNDWGYTSGHGVLLTPNPDRILFGLNRDSNGRPNIMGVGESLDLAGNGNMLAVIMRNDLPVTRILGRRHHPTTAGTTYLGRYRISNMTRPSKVLGANPIRVNVGSSYARISETAHGRAAGSFVSLARATATLTFGWLLGTGNYDSRSYYVHGRFPVIRHERLAFTAGDVEPLIGATVSKGGVSAQVQGVVLSSGSWSANNAAGYLEIINRSGGSFTSGSMTSGATLTVSGAQTADADAYMVDTADNNLSASGNNQPVPRERIAFTAGQVAPTIGGTITQGGVTAVVVYIAVTSGTWTAAATGRAAGYIGIRNLAGGSFSAGAATGGGTFNISGAQTAATAQGGGSNVRIVGEVDFADMGREVRDFFMLNGSPVHYWTGTGNTSTVIYRGTDTLGDTAPTWHTLAGGRLVEKHRFAADPFHAERVLYGSGSTVREIRNIGGSLVDSVLIDLRAMGISPYLTGAVGAYGERLVFTAGSVAPTIGGTITKGGVSARVDAIKLSSGSWAGGNAAGYLTINARTGGSFTAGAMTVGATLNVTAAQYGGYTIAETDVGTILNDYKNPGFFFVIVSQQGVPGMWMTETNGYERLDFTGGSGASPVAGTTLTQGIAIARTQNVYLTTGSWAAGTAAGYMEISNRTGGNFAPGAMTAGAAFNVTAQQTGGWENVTDYLPRAPFLGVVHPFTGDIMVFSSKGRFIRPPAPGYPNVPARGATYNQVRDFYNQVGVPQPPVY